MKKVIVIGGGAAGLMAAYAAGNAGNEVLLLEKNEKLGKKIYITGKGRCNLTNDCAPSEFLESVVRGKKFLTGAVYRFPPSAVMEFFERFGCPLKVERGNRVFPVSDHASDVTKALERACAAAGVRISLKTEVKSVIPRGIGMGVVTERGELAADAVIVATGGLSYPSTGSTGDGYRFASTAGHTLEPRVPSLVGMEVAGVSAAQGVSLKNVNLTAVRGGKTIFSRQGEMLFTHYGISGPLVLTLSALANRIPPKELALYLDFKPALDEKTLDERLLRDFSARVHEQMKNVMRGLLPAGCTELVLFRAAVPPEKRPSEITREERARLVSALKAFPLRCTGLRGFDEAVITSGGVQLSELDPRTLKSKIVPALSFAGEVIDVDCLTGGFNLQTAFSTGYLAGISV